MKIHLCPPIALAAFTLALRCNPLAAADNVTPVITSITPASATAGDATQTISVKGSAFYGFTTILWTTDSGTEPLFIIKFIPPDHPNELVAIIPAEFLRTAGTVKIVASNPGLITSNPVTFTINPPGTSATPPVLNNLTPNSSTVGAPGFTITANGTGFVSGATVRWNGSGIDTSFVSATTLTASVPAALSQDPGIATVEVANPGGAVSNQLPFTIGSVPVVEPSPVTISSLSPNQTRAGAPGFTITVTGSGFVSDSNIGWNGTLLPTTFVNSSQLTAVVSADLIQAAGSATVAVINSDGATSGSLTFIVRPATVGGTDPVVSGLSPTSATLGSAPFALTVVGSGFVSGSVVVWNGSGLITTFASSSRLTALVPSFFIQTAGSVAVSVTNPGGSTSNALPFSVDPDSFAISALAPSTATAGAARFTLTVRGSGFITGAAVQWNGTSLTTTFLNPSILTVSVPPALVQNSGTADITVLNPGGALSSALTFTILPPPAAGTPPSITSLSPDSTIVGGPNFTLAVVGEGFLNGAAIQWNGKPLTTAVLSANLLTATVPASSVQSIGTASVTVSNPDGTVSGALTFSVNGNPAILTSLTPDQVNAGGGAITLCAAGSRIAQYALMLWNGSPIETAVLSDTLACATVPASLTGLSGTAHISLKNPSSSPSNPLVFSILGPPSVAAGRL